MAKDFRDMTPMEAARHYAGVNVYHPDVLKVWSFRSLSSGDPDKIAQAKTEWKAEGYAVTLKTYSEFQSLSGAKRIDKSSI
jgi:hypothetical protein